MFLVSDTSLNARRYCYNEVAVVYRTNDQFGGLSNMAAGFPLFVADTEIRTSEALYQACRFPNNTRVQKEILSQASPMTAKHKSRLHGSETRPDWDSIRHMVMRWCLRVKLAQHYDKFSELLLSTGEKPIVERSQKDDFWGAKLVSEKYGNFLVGTNVLGRLLMEMRERLNSDRRYELRSVPELGISNFKLLGKSIGTIGDDTPPHLKGNQRDLF